MLHALLTLIAFQLVGDLIADFSSVPVPGMVIGLLLLLAAIGLRGRMLGADRAVPPELSQVAKSLHDHLGLLFVPAGAGIMANVTNLAADGIGLLVAVLISTVATIGVTAFLAGSPRAEQTPPKAIVLE
jgi:holin-like protein